jgi:hypothetical protein
MSGQYQERERREYLKQYREKNKDRLQQKRHDYYGENKDRIKEYAEQWKQDHSSMVCVPKQEYFEKNKDKINESRRRKCAENKEQINQKKKNTEKLRKPKISQFEIIFPYSKVLQHLWL